MPGEELENSAPTCLFQGIFLGKAQKVVAGRVVVKGVVMYRRIIRLRTKSSKMGKVTVAENVPVPDPQRQQHVREASCFCVPHPPWGMSCPLQPTAWGLHLRGSG